MAEPNPPAEESSTQEIWYYLKPNAKEPTGPLPADELRYLFTTKQISHQTLVWTPGWQEWKQIAQVPSLHRTEKVKMVPANEGFRRTGIFRVPAKTTGATTPTEPGSESAPADAETPPAAPTPDEKKS
ncbi:MAG: DUF4339 domain-containing protein [Verrucomicrobiae bacterium]|nr:DUF4339 domain-containing protein [Verrucomicrobiae bacterium]